MATNSYAIRLPWPPSINHYWRTRVNGNRAMQYISAEGKRFRSEVAATAEPRRMAGRLSVSVELTMPDRRRRDIDNVLKCVLDALEHAEVFLNDSQIDRLHVFRLHVEPPGCADVTVTEL